MATSNIAGLERAVSNQVAIFEQESQSVAKDMNKTKVNSLNMKWPVYEGMRGYAQGSNTGGGGAKTQVLGESVKYLPVDVFTNNTTTEVPIEMKRALMVLDDPMGTQLVSLISKNVVDSRLVVMERNIETAVTGRTYSNGVGNLFQIGDINAIDGVAGGAFRKAISDAISK